MQTIHVAPMATVPAAILALQTQQTHKEEAAALRPVSVVIRACTDPFAAAKLVSQDPVPRTAAPAASQPTDCALARLLQQPRRGQTHMPSPGLAPLRRSKTTRSLVPRSRASS